MKMSQMMKRGILFLLALCMSLTLLTGCGGAPASSGGEQGGSEQGENEQGASSSSSEGGVDSGALMVGDLYVLNNMNIRKWNMPVDLSEASSAEDAVRYAAARAGLPYSIEEIRDGDPREWEGDNDLIYFIYDQIYNVMVDEEFNVIVPHERRDGDKAFMFTRKTITDAMEYIFGIPNYEVDAMSWDAKADRYIIIFTAGVRDKKHEIQLAGEVEWINQNEYTLSVYCYETTDLSKVVVEDWYRRIDLTMERDQKEIYTFYVTGIDIVEP